MAYVEGLSGLEIVDDIVAQVRKRLMQDCNLRGTDSYGRGYSGKITISLKLYAMDVYPVEQELEVKTPEPPPVATEEIQVTPVEIAEELEIKQEEDLNVVRDRINDDPEPVLATGGEEPATQLRTKRKYTRTKTLEHAAAGGAVDLTTEF